jgi:hypothetical protein
MTDINKAAKEIAEDFSHDDSEERVLTDAIVALVEKVREDCAGAVCPYCRIGVPVEYQDAGKTWIHDGAAGMWKVCLADAIRSGGKA